MEKKVSTVSGDNWLVVDGGQMMSDNGENRRWLLLRSEKEVQEKGFCLVWVSMEKMELGQRFLEEKA